MLSRNQVRAGLLNLLLVSEHICHSLRGVAIPAPTSRLSEKFWATRSRYYTNEVQRPGLI